MATCRTCDADWSEGEFTDNCGECGGGAMTIACPACQGACNSIWQRAVIDFNDNRIGHFYGRCMANPAPPKR